MDRPLPSQYEIMAFSIGSYASGSQAIPITAQRSRSLPSFAHVSHTVIRFVVMVPVLSTQRTDTAPSVSTEASLRISECLFASRHAPMERKTVKITGNSSGIMAMASVTPERMLSISLSVNWWSGIFSQVKQPTNTNRTAAMAAQSFTSPRVCL